MLLDFEGLNSTGICSTLFLVLFEYPIKCKMYVIDDGASQENNICKILVEL